MNDNDLPGIEGQSFRVEFNPAFDLWAQTIRTPMPLYHMQDFRGTDASLDPNGRIGTSPLESHGILSINLDAIDMNDHDYLQAQRAMFENNLMWGPSESNRFLRGTGIWEQLPEGMYNRFYTPFNSLNIDEYGLEITLEF